jgi:hypothetical protein
MEQRSIPTRFFRGKARSSKAITNQQKQTISTATATTTPNTISTTTASTPTTEKG